jgi:hypothetical protein
VAYSYGTMDFAETSPPDRRENPASGAAELRQVQVGCDLPEDEHRRFTEAAKRHGAGTTSGQVRVLIREWMRGLNPADTDQVAA